MVMGVEGWVTNAIPLRHFPNIIHNSNTWGWVVGSLAGSSCVMYSFHFIIQYLIPILMGLGGNGYGGPGVGH